MKKRPTPFRRTIRLAKVSHGALAIASEATRDEPPPSSNRIRFWDLASTAGRFGLVGLLKTSLDFATFNLVLLTLSRTDAVVVLVANTAGFAVAVASSFVLNARFTFRAGAVHHGFTRYVLVSLLGLVLYNGTLALVLALADPEGTLALNVAKVVALFASMAWNFLGYRWFVFTAPPRSI